MASPKKAKKSALAKSATIVDLNDHTVLNRRAQRFQREHDIERQKISGSLKASHSAPSLHHRTPVSFTSDPNDDPEVNPVSLYLTSSSMCADFIGRMFLIGIGLPSLVPRPRFSRITSV